MQIYSWQNLTADQRSSIMTRPAQIENLTLRRTVKKILRQVYIKGDIALRQLTRKYDAVPLDTIAVNESDIEKIPSLIDDATIEAIQFAYDRIQLVHQATMKSGTAMTVKNFSAPDIKITPITRPIQNVGLYIPGGQAPLISTVLMLGVPAQLAGCENIILCTPPQPDGDIHPSILMAASLCGIKSIYKIGGAQAIAAMAYGTETIPKVDKIFGPGNAWVTEAKIQIASQPLSVTIDMPAGPTEVLVIADNDADAAYVAADLLAQAEHSVDAQAILLCFDTTFAKEVIVEIKKQLAVLSTAAVIEKSLAHARIIVMDDIQQAIDTSNHYAPEHLILNMNQAEKYLPSIKNAGTIFLGPWTAETLGDYVTGSNHVLPTYGYAKSVSGLTTDDFMKTINVQEVTHCGYTKLAPHAFKLASIEGLSAHANAIRVRQRVGDRE